MKVYRKQYSLRFLPVFLCVPLIVSSKKAESHGFICLARSQLSCRLRLPCWWKSLGAVWSPNYILAFDLNLGVAWRIGYGIGMIHGDVARESYPSLVHQDSSDLMMMIIIIIIMIMIMIMIKTAWWSRKSRFSLIPNCRCSGRHRICVHLVLSTLARRSVKFEKIALKPGLKPPISDDTDTVVTNVQKNRWLLWPTNTKSWLPMGALVHPFGVSLSNPRKGAHLVLVLGQIATCPSECRWDNPSFRNDFLLIPGVLGKSKKIESLSKGKRLSRRGWSGCNSRGVGGRPPRPNHRS